METRKYHVRDVSTITDIMQYEHCVQSIYFLGLEDFEGTVYLSVESDDYHADIELTNNTFIIGQPMTKFCTTYYCQIYGIVKNGDVDEKIKLSKRFRMVINKSNDISGESSEYPIDPNIKNAINLYIDQKEKDIDDYVDQVIDRIPADYATLEQSSYNAYPTQSETGNPIYFDDGAEDIPVKELIVNLEPKQSGSGDPSPSNVRPISGYDGVVVKRAGKNLLQNSMSSVTKQGITYTVNSDGSVTVNGTATANTYLSIACNIPLIVAMIGSGAPKVSNVRIDFMTNDGYAYADNYDGASQANGVQLPTNKTLTSVRCRIENGTTVNNVTFYPMVRNASDTDSAFEPYTGQEYSVTFPSNVGTVYGGSLNVTTGELVVEKAKLNNSTWTIDTTFQRAYFSRRATFEPSVSNDIASDKVICSKLPTISLNDLMNNKTQGIALSTSGALSLHITGLTDKSSFTQEEVNTWLSDVDIIYKLATPLTYQLTPTEVTTLIQGNTFMSDGEINLTYRQDTNTVIDRLVNAIISLGGNV